MSALSPGARFVAGAVAIAVLVGCVPDDRTDDGEENGSTARAQEDVANDVGRAVAEAVGATNLRGQFINCAAGPRGQYQFEASMPEVALADAAAARAATADVRRQLETLGHEIVDGDTGFRLIDDEHPDLDILVDDVPPPGPPYFGSSIEVLTRCEAWSDADQMYADSVNYATS